MNSRNVLPLLLFMCRIHAQSQPDLESCPVIATLPADLNWTEPLEQRQRFQLRQCAGDPVIVTAYEKGKAAPSMLFDTGDGYPSYLVHKFNALVFQSMGGASDHVYVFAFRNGKPSLALKAATKHEIEVKQSGKTRHRHRIAANVPRARWKTPATSTAQATYLPA